MSRDSLSRAAWNGAAAAIIAMVWQTIDHRYFSRRARRIALGKPGRMERLGYHVGRIISLLRH